MVASSVKGQERRPMPTIGKLKPSLRKRRIEMRLQRMPMELDFLNSLIGIRMRSERPSLGQTMQGQQVTFSYQTFLARLRLLIYGWSGELSLISMRISSMVTAWRAACRSILSKELSVPTIEPNNPVIPLPSTAPSLSTGKLTT
nr:hypothetical protein [Tanacetum cinerariifolium]